MNVDFNAAEAWLVTGSQNLYGPETLNKVAEHSQHIAAALSVSPAIPVKVIFKPVLTTSEAIHKLCLDANTSRNCIGLVAWMHTFSPAKMWIAGLKALQKPLAHLHTQYNRDIPWADIDMDFMNLNQSAHGGREFGFIGARLRRNRKIIVGHWQDEAVQKKLAVWMRAAVAWHDAQGAKIARFGDNMRRVAVTEGDKVEAQVKFGWSVDGHGVGDLAAEVNKIDETDIDKLLDEYKELYHIAGSSEGFFTALREAARIELGMRAFLEQGEFKALTTTFEDLHGLAQLPGLAVQRLMEDGYGFGAEGDWKTAALVRAMKVMGAGLPGGASFMEDYTYHFAPDGARVLGAHMLEVCPSIAAGRPSLEVHPLGIGGKAAPARLVFNAAAGPGLNASIIDMGSRFRMLVNEVEVASPEADLPNLPVARALWRPKPSLEIAAGAWILAGGAHHAGFSTAITTEHIEDFGDMADIELIVINDDAMISELKKELRWNEVYYHLRGGF